MLFNSHAEFISAFIYKEIPKQVRNDEKPNSHAELVFSLSSVLDSETSSE